MKRIKYKEEQGRLSREGDKRLSMCGLIINAIFKKWSVLR